MPSLAHDVREYERWLRDHCKVVKGDLEHKHKRMCESPFVFLRATYFRWAATIEKVCHGFSEAPRVLCVGDTHVENFGTWRDAESRHVWGINDFDEAAVMPYSYDLIRLMTSARLSPNIKVAPEVAADAVLRGYVEGLLAPGPTLLDEHASWLRSLIRRLKDTTDEFWADLESCPDAVPPSAVRRALRRSLPGDAVVSRFASRRRGGGSLGRQRFIAIAQWRGGQIVREAKAMVPSAWNWARKTSGSLRFLDLAHGVYRAPDMSLALSDAFLVRRVAPDSRKLDLGDVAKLGLSETTLEAMGRDVASMHAAHRRSASIADDLDRRGPEWLRDAASAAQRAVESDFHAWLEETRPTIGET